MIRSCAFSGLVLTMEVSIAKASETTIHQPWCHPGFLKKSMIDQTTLISITGKTKKWKGGCQRVWFAFWDFAAMFISSLNCLFFVQIEYDGINAVAQLCRLRAIVEDVSEMCIATGTENLGSHHSMAGINSGAHIFLRARRREAGPTAPRVKLVV